MREAENVIKCDRKEVLLMGYVFRYEVVFIFISDYCWRFSCTNYIYKKMYK